MLKGVNITIIQDLMFKLNEVQCVILEQLAISTYFHDRNKKFQPGVVTQTRVAWMFVRITVKSCVGCENAVKMDHEIVME